MLPIAASLWPYYTLQPPAVHTQLARSALAPAHAFQPKIAHLWHYPYACLAGG
jgi:hypothetical protein